MKFLKNYMLLVRVHISFSLTLFMAVCKRFFHLSSLNVKFRILHSEMYITCYNMLSREVHLLEKDGMYPYEYMHIYYLYVCNSIYVCIYDLQSASPFKGWHVSV